MFHLSEHWRRFVCLSVLIHTKRLITDYSDNSGAVYWHFTNGTNSAVLVLVLTLLALPLVKLVLVLRVLALALLLALKVLTLVLIVLVLVPTIVALVQTIRAILHTDIMCTCTDSI